MYRIRRNFHCAEIFVGPLNPTKIKPTKTLPPRIITACCCVPVTCVTSVPRLSYANQCFSNSSFPAPMVVSKRGIQHPSVHRANCQGSKFFVAPNFMGDFNHKNLTHEIFHLQKFLRIYDISKNRRCKNLC